MVDRCLRDDSVEFDIFHGVSDNEWAWIDIEHAREVIGYDPIDRGHEASPPNGPIRDAIRESLLVFTRQIRRARRFIGFPKTPN